MDPNTTLQELLDLANAVLFGGFTQEDADSAAIAAEEMAERVVALHEWISNGGFLPDAWQEVRAAALNPAAKKIQELQQMMDSGEITPEEFESYLEQLESKQHTGAVKTADNFQRDEFSEFLDGYLETALWSSHDESDESGGEPMDQNYTTEDIADECLQKMQQDAQKFFDDNYTVMDEAEVRYGPGLVTLEHLVIAMGLHYRWVREGSSSNHADCFV